VAVTGFGRTTMSNVAPPVVELTLDGPVELVLQPAKTVATSKPRTTDNLFTVSPSGHADRTERPGTSERACGDEPDCEVDAGRPRWGFFAVVRRNRRPSAAAHHVCDMRVTFA
jgi:hypothetical protein